jgi:hypothetical protein
MATKDHERLRKSEAQSRFERSGVTGLFVLGELEAGRLAKWAASTILITSTVILDFAALHRGYEWPRKSEAQSRFERSGVTGLFVLGELEAGRLAK